MFANDTVTAILQATDTHMHLFTAPATQGKHKTISTQIQAIIQWDYGDTCGE